MAHFENYMRLGSLRSMESMRLERFQQITSRLLRTIEDYLQAGLLSHICQDNKMLLV